MSCHLHVQSRPRKKQGVDEKDGDGAPEYPVHQGTGAHAGMEQCCLLYPLNSIAKRAKLRQCPNTSSGCCCVVRIASSIEGNDVYGTTE